MIGRLASWAGGLLVVAFVLAFLSPGTFVFEIPFFLAFGWAVFMKHNLHAVQPNALLIVEAAVCMVALGVGGHYFARWLWRQVAPAGATGWRPQWTALGLAGLLLLFVAGIATIGITHQTAWLFTTREAFLVDSWSIRVRMPEVLVEGSGPRQQVTDYFQATGKLPASAREADIGVAPQSKYVKALSVRNGVVTIDLADGFVKGGRVTLTPVVNEGRLEWKCSSNLQPRDLPGSCRD